MCYNSICYLFLFCWINLEWFTCFMNHHFTTILWFSILIENWGYINFFFTASKLIISSKRSMKGHLYLWLLLMHMTITHLCNMIIYIASFTFKNVKIWPNLPINFTPGNSVGLSNKCYEFFEIPGSVNNMLCSDLSVIVNIWFSFVTV